MSCVTRARYRYGHSPHRAGLFAAQIPLGGLNADVREQELNLLEFSSSQVAESCTCAAQIVRCKFARLHVDEARLTTSQMTFGVKPCGGMRPALLIARKIGLVIEAADNA